MMKVNWSYSLYLCYFLFLFQFEFQNIRNVKFSLILKQWNPLEYWDGQWSQMGWIWGILKKINLGKKQGKQQKVIQRISIWENDKTSVQSSIFIQDSREFLIFLIFININISVVIRINQIKSILVWEIVQNHQSLP